MVQYVDTRSILITYLGTVCMYMEPGDATGIPAWSWPRTHEPFGPDQIRLWKSWRRGNVKSASLVTSRSKGRVRGVDKRTRISRARGAEGLATLAIMWLSR